MLKTKKWCLEADSEDYLSRHIPAILSGPSKQPRRGKKKSEKTTDDKNHCILNLLDY